MVKVRVEQAVYFLLIFFFSDSMFVITIVTDLLPVLFSAHQVFHLCCKVILNQNLVVTLSDILASYHVSLCYLLI